MMALDENAAAMQAAYEPPTIECLGTLAELTHGALSTDTDGSGGLAGEVAQFS